MIRTIDESTDALYIELPYLKAPEADRSWRKLSACASNGAPFFDGHRVAEAKAVCATCTVSAQCLSFALANEIKDGVWGGLTAKERKAL